MTRPAQPDHGGQITIGLRDLYDQLQQVQIGQSQLASKLDTALLAQTLGQQSNAQQLADIRHDQNDHEMRIRAQEAKPYVSPRAVWTGVATIVAGLSVVFSILQVVFQK